MGANSIHRGMCVGCLAAALLSPEAGAESLDLADWILERSSPTDFGSVGLLQNPTARFAGDGQVMLGGSITWPYNRYFVTAQVASWLEVTIRYTDITNRLYGPVSFSGHQTYKDKGVDLKMRLTEESRRLPQLAVGIRDLGGTRLFGGEYLVGSKRYYSWDFTLGVGWGSLGNRGTFRNPLASLSDRFGGTREFGTLRQSGRIAGDLFAGERVGLFGGVTWRLPARGMTLKVEYDGNDYQREPLENDQHVASPFNFSVGYAPRKGIEISVGLERGNEVTAKIVIRSDLGHDPGTVKQDEPPAALRIRARNTPQPANRPRSGSLPVPRGHPGPGAVTKPIDPDLGKRTIAALERGGFGVLAVDATEREMTAWVSQSTFREIPRGVGRAARIMANQAAPDVGVLTVANLEWGMETGRTSLLRGDLENALTGQGSPEEIRENARLSVTDGRIPPHAFANPERYPGWGVGIGPVLKQHVGGPNNFYFWELWASISGDVWFSRRLSATAEVGIDLVDNLADLELESNSLLPHVRSDIKDYLKEGKSNLVRFQFDYMWKPSANWYARLSAGIFEEMYGGASGELLYRHYGSRWAVGVDLNRVRKRAFDQRLDFLDYKVTTGHVTLYYEGPHGLSVRMSAGRYLAADLGVTLDVSREFESGARVGAFVTRTNVSARQFGEGGYDKGFYLRFPTDRLFTKSRRDSFEFAWRPLTRDGGQMVRVGRRLYGFTDPASRGRMEQGWHRILD